MCAPGMQLGSFGAQLTLGRAYALENAAKVSGISFLEASFFPRVPPVCHVKADDVGAVHEHSCGEACSSSSSSLGSSSSDAADAAADSKQPSLPCSQA